MSSLSLPTGIVHYEVMGRGTPIIFLHGWLGSWQLWRTVMEKWSPNHRCYAVDFWGFGDSHDTGQFQVADYAELVHDFISALGLPPLAIVGHSMGGTTALMVALRYPKSVEKVVTVGSPIVGSSLSIYLKMMGHPLVARSLYRWTSLFRLFTQFYVPVSRNKSLWREMALADFQDAGWLVAQQSIASLHNVDLQPQLRNLALPVLGIFGKYDNVVKPNQADVMKKTIPHAEVITLQDSRHFPMLEEPGEFEQLLEAFLK